MNEALGQILAVLAGLGGLGSIVAVFKIRRELRKMKAEQEKVEAEKVKVDAEKVKVDAEKEKVDADAVDVLSQATTRLIQPLSDRIATLENTITSLETEVGWLRKAVVTTDHLISVHARWDDMVERLLTAAGIHYPERPALHPERTSTDLHDPSCFVHQECGPEYDHSR